MTDKYLGFTPALGTCSNFAAERVLSTKYLFPFNLRLKPFLYLYCRVELQHTDTKVQILSPFYDLDLDYSSRSEYRVLSKALPSE